MEACPKVLSFTAPTTHIWLLPVHTSLLERFFSLYNLEFISFACLHSKVRFHPLAISCGCFSWSSQHNGFNIACASTDHKANWVQWNLSEQTPWNVDYPYTMDKQLISNRSWYKLTPHSRHFLTPNNRHFHLTERHSTVQINLITDAMPC